MNINHSEMIEQLQACNVSQKVIADSVNTTQANISRIKAGQEPKAGLGRAIEDLYLQKRASLKRGILTTEKWKSS